LLTLDANKDGDGTRQELTAFTKEAAALEVVASENRL
jgi:hypothetical protein